ncbi:hypothetical protein EUTSA_v10012382mg, partial [Eutrema salsugineum]
MLLGLEGEEDTIRVENQPRALLDRSQIFKTRNWWIWIFFSSGRDVCDDPKQFKGTWLQSMVQNAAFPFTAFLLLLWRFLFSNHRETNSLFILFLLFFFQLYAIERTHCVFFFWIFTTQVVIYSNYQQTKIIISSIILCGVPIGITSSDDAYYPCEGEGWKMSYGVWCAFFGMVAFSLSLCIMQLRFQKVIPNRESKVSAVLKMQTNASMIATLICLVGLFVSREFKDIKEDFETFKQGKPLYVLSLIGLSLAWQVMPLGLVGLVCLASSLFSNVVSFGATPLANILVVVAFRFMDDDIEWFKGGALLAGIK